MMMVFYSTMVCTILALSINTLHVPNVNPRSPSVVSVTRKDVLDDVFGFTMGALAAETVIKLEKITREIQHNSSIDKSFAILEAY